MRVVIVAKTRRGRGACVGGLTCTGQSVRLVPADAATNERAGHEYAVGEVWDVECAPDPCVIPPHVENVVVHRGRCLDQKCDVEKFIAEHMPPAAGGPSVLFEGLTHSSITGALYIAKGTGLPSRSTMFWTPDQPLQLDLEGKRIRYRFPSRDGGRTLTFVGFQDAVPSIPAGTLLRVSLAHWWRPQDRPEEELRCYVQLSGWWLAEMTRARAPSASPAARGEPSTSTSLPIESVTPAPAISLRSGASAAAGLSAALGALKRHFGFSQFLPTQQRVVERVMQGKDTLAVMPTGGGKSLCYQLPALLFRGLTVVVSPLIALMQDQVAQLDEAGVSAAFLNCTLLHHEYLAVVNRARSGSVRILYAAPETLLRPETILLLEQCGVACVAVDEAHCISEWGHDFRPEYRQLSTVRQRFPRAVWVALTATATGRVRQDIRQLLQIPREGEFVASFNRPNLHLGAQPRQEGLEQILAFLESHRGQSGIIYCSTRKSVDQLSAELQSRQWPALAYHAGLRGAARRENQTQFIREDAAIMVATIAFGMGINKSNVRFVLHFNLPKDLESYYQEIGRAGRDGLNADCLLLHTPEDAVAIRRLIARGAASERDGRHARLQAMVSYAETTGCRRVPLLGYFGESAPGPCDACDNCALSALNAARERARGGSPPPPSCAGPPTPGSGEFSPELFDQLRALRRQLAREAGLPPYIIFSDRSLVEMATRRPQEEGEFLQIHGVGEVRLAKYGAAFLARIRALRPEARRIGPVGPVGRIGRIGTYGTP